MNHFSINLGIRALACFEDCNEAIFSLPVLRSMFYFVSVFMIQIGQRSSWVMLLTVAPG